MDRVFPTSPFTSLSVHSSGSSLNVLELLMMEAIGNVKWTVNWSSGPKRPQKCLQILSFSYPRANVRTFLFDATTVNVLSSSRAFVTVLLVRELPKLRKM